MLSDPFRLFSTLYDLFSRFFCQFWNIVLGPSRTLLAVFNLFLVFLSWVKIFLHFLTPSDFLKLFFTFFDVLEPVLDHSEPSWTRFLCY